MKFDLSMEDYTIILNALHYYKKVEKYPNFAHFDETRINELRDKMAHQLVWKQELWQLLLIMSQPFGLW